MIRRRFHSMACIRLNNVRARRSPSGGSGGAPKRPPRLRKAGCPSSADESALVIQAERCAEAELTRRARPTSRCSWTAGSTTWRRPVWRPPNPARIQSRLRLPEKIALELGGRRITERGGHVPIARATMRSRARAGSPGGPALAERRAAAPSRGPTRRPRGRLCPGMRAGPRGPVEDDADGRRGSMRVFQSERLPETCSKATVLRGSNDLEAGTCERRVVTDRRGSAAAHAEVGAAKSSERPQPFRGTRKTLSGFTSRWTTPTAGA